MAQSRLPFPELDIRLAEILDEPDIWLRRLVFVESLQSPVRVIRRISFRRGLNIIGTEPRRSEDTQPVGHSVGKSLLVRIIRYCLGEDRFCTGTQRTAIAVKFERAYALAVVRVKGVDWAVARPLGLDSGYSDSWCVRSSCLKDLVEKDNRLKYREFVDTLNECTRQCYAEIDLPTAQRRASWKDLLGWLSRDQDCHFDHHADWRTAELQAGPRSLSREDAYLVMRMALGLLGPKEIGLIEQHRELLARKNQAEALARQYEAYFAQAEPRLRQALDELKDLPAGEVFGAAFINIADEKIQSLDRLLEDPAVLDRQELSDLQETLSRSLRAEGALENRLEELTTKETATLEELANARTQDAPTLLKTLAGLRWKCSFYKTKDEAAVAGCPGDTMINQGIADPWRTHRIEELDAELSGIREEMRTLQTERTEAQDKSAKARKTLSQRTAEYVRVRGDITRQSGQWTARRDEADRYCSAWRDLKAIEDGRGARQKAIDESEETLRKARRRFEKQKSDLSAVYDAVLKRTIAPGAEGSIEVDGDGLRPSSNAIVADSGTTLREYADVLSFDLACLAASTCGFGHLPRFWIHDSPRQADSEEQLYYSVLRFISELEAKYPRGRKPSFQYILTTTSPPPEEVNRPPYVRLRLHARAESGKLLRRDFGK